MDDASTKVVTDGSGYLLNGGILALVGGAMWRAGRFLAPLITRWIESHINFVDKLRDGFLEQKQLLIQMKKDQDDKFRELLEELKEMVGSQEKDNADLRLAIQKIGEAISRMADSSQDHAEVLKAVTTLQERVLRQGEKPDGNGH